MIDVNTIEVTFSLSQVKPFDALTESELLLIAQHARARSFDADALMLKAGDIPEALFIRRAGDVTTGDGPAPDVFDAPSVLFGLPAHQDYNAGPDGAEVLCLAKPHLFTIARECPDFIIGLTEAVGRS